MSHKVAILHIFVGALLTCLLVAIFLFGGSRLSVFPALVLLLPLPVATLTGGIGLLRRRYWGYVTVMILSGFWIFVLPIGTLLGAFSLWVLVKEPVLPDAADGASIASA